MNKALPSFGAAFPRTIVLDCTCYMLSIGIKEMKKGNEVSGCPPRARPSTTDTGDSRTVAGHLGEEGK